MSEVGQKTELSPYDLQQRTALFEYLRHLTALSTGAIILQIALLEKVFQPPRWRALFIVSLLLFALSVVAAVACYTFILTSHPPPRGNPWMSDDSLDVLIGLLMIVVWAGFLLGLLTLSLFAIRNILSL
jgi:hypothetical protein